MPAPPGRASQPSHPWFLPAGAGWHRPASPASFLPLEARLCPLLLAPKGNASKGCTHAGPQPPQGPQVLLRDASQPLFASAWGAVTFTVAGRAAGSQEGFPPGERVELSSLRSANFNFGEGEDQQHPDKVCSPVTAFTPFPCSLPLRKKKSRGDFGGFCFDAHPKEKPRLLSPGRSGGAPTLELLLRAQERVCLLCCRGAVSMTTPGRCSA